MNDTILRAIADADEFRAGEQLPRFASDQEIAERLQRLDTLAATEWPPGPYEKEQDELIDALLTRLVIDGEEPL